MRGGAFHNWMVERVVEMFLSYGWEVETEFCCRRNGVVTFFDVYAVKDGREVAVEVETSIRHVVDNVLKAWAVGVEVWIVVGRRRLKRMVGERLDRFSLAEFRDEVLILLVAGIRRELDEM